MPTVTILKEARALLSDESRWERGTWAALKSGLACEVTAPKAYSFCAGGAIRRAAFLHGGDAMVAMESLGRANDLGGMNTLWQWNDDRDRSFEEIVAAFDKAIAAVEAATA